MFAMQRIDKMAAVAAAVAHDMNDELTVIRSVLALIDQDQAFREDLVDAQAAAQRASWLIGRMLRFARQRGAGPNAETADSLIDRITTDL